MQPSSAGAHKLNTSIICSEYFTYNLTGHFHLLSHFNFSQQKNRNHLRNDMPRKYIGFSAVSSCKEKMEDNTVSLCLSFLWPTV